MTHNNRCIVTRSWLEKVFLIVVHSKDGSVLYIICMGYVWIQVCSRHTYMYNVQHVHVHVHVHTPCVWVMYGYVKVRDTFSHMPVRSPRLHCFFLRPCPFMEQYVMNGLNPLFLEYNMYSIM